MGESSLPQMPSWSLAGKRALITGASSGIGRAAAATLAHAGAALLVTARRSDALDALAAEVRAAGGSAETAAVDATDLDAMKSLIESKGPFDILVNNAGGNRAKPVLETTPEDFDAIMGLNVKACFFAAAEVARGLIAAGKPGSIINISSQMGHVSGPKRALYSASKFAVEGFTRGMALEWGEKGIRVNALCPTFIRTPMTERFLDDDAFMEQVIGKIALGRLGTVEDLMGAVAYLASDASALVTGSSLMVDGGWTAA